MGKSSRLKKNRLKKNKKAPNTLARPAQTTRRTLGLAMIMKNEVEDLDRIIKDYGSFFDKIYVTVTDKKTHTALSKRFPDDSTNHVELSYFKWIDHFGKARLYNQQQAKTDYWMWIDLDDEIEGANRLHEVVAYMDTNGIDAVWFQYSYLRRVNLSDPESIQWKVRVVRTASKLEWSDEAVHENIYMQSDIEHRRISETDVMVKHRKTNDQLSISAERNRVILERDWQQNHRAITATYQGRDFMMSGEYERAIEKFLFVTEHSVNVALKFDAWENICEGYFQIGNYTAALAAANERMAIDPEHPGPWYQKFAAYGAMGNLTDALQSAETAMSKRIQDVEGDIGILLNHDPSWYQYKAPFNVARAYLSIGNNKRAYELYQQVEKIAPGYIDEQSKAMGVNWSDAFEQAAPKMISGIDYLHSLVIEAVNAGHRYEGTADAAELNYLASIAKDSDVKLIAEIGFNSGMSSHAFLEANPKAIVYSFDLGEYGYVQPAKEYIDQHFPGRHHMILGDSRVTAPRFLKENPDMKFDLIFVDGGHDYEVAKADLLNMQPFAKPTTRLITDDLTPWKPWGIGPTKAWLELIEQGIVEQQELWKDGEKVDSIAPSGERSWVLGKYLFDSIDQ